MKNGKKLTRKEKEFFRSCNLNPDNWLRVKDTSRFKEFVHIISGKTRIINK